ncbi:MAG: hypothetical protein RRC34_03105 [Lentisphaeria bacterium]|nr:hypothetical protein [Lentisphaeria bacterium]
MNNRILMAIGLMCAALLLDGCAFNRLKKDLSKINALKPVSGTLINDAQSSSPVVVILWSLDDDSKNGTGYWVVHRDGSFKFLRPGGRYYLLAFEDSNEDLHYQETERAAAFGEPSIIDLDIDGNFEHLELRLLPPGRVKIPESILNMSAEARQAKFAARQGQVSTVTTIDDPVFNLDHAALGLWEPLSFAEQLGVKVYFLEPYNPDKIPILFVHGAVGYPGTWKEIIGSLDREKFQPWVVFYPSGLRLDMLADIYSKHIDELRLKHQFKDLIVVAHSMGGLVSRSMIQKYARLESRCSIPLYITISTPWAGHSGAAMGVEHAPAVVPAWYDMTPGSSFIEGVFSTPLPPETAYYLFFSYQADPGMKFGGENSDGAVALSSELFLQAQEESVRATGINDSHVGILSNTNTLRILNQIFDLYAHGE